MTDKLTCKKLRNLLGSKLVFSHIKIEKNTSGIKNAVIIDSKEYILTNKAMYYLNCFGEAKACHGYDDREAFLLAFCSDEYVYIKAGKQVG